MIRNEGGLNSEKEGENVIVQKKHKVKDASFIKNDIYRRQLGEEDLTWYERKLKISCFLQKL